MTNHLQFVSCLVLPMNSVIRDMNLMDGSNYVIQVAVHYEATKFIVNSKGDNDWGETIDLSNHLDFSSGIAIPITTIKGRSMRYRENFVWP